METTARARRAVAIAFAIQGLTFASLLTRLPAMKDKFDLSDVDILLLVLAVAGASAVGSAVAGQAATRWGSAWTLRLSLVGASLAVALPGVAGNFGALVALTSVYGLCVGAVDASMNMQGVAVQDAYGRSIMTSFHAVWSLGAALGAGYAALTAELDWSLGLSLIVITGFGLAVNLIACGGMLSVEADPLETPTAAGRLAPVPFWPVLLIALPTFAMWLNDGAVSTWSGIYMEDGLKASATAAPAAYGAYQVCLFLVRVVGDRFVQGYGAPAVVRIGGWVATAGGLLVVVAPGVWLVVLGFALLGLGLSLVPPLAMVAAAHAAPGAGDRAVARVNVSNYAGFIVAAVAIAAISELVSARAMFVLPAIVLPYLALAARRFAAQPAALPVTGSETPAIKE
ncbi:MFS transporter [Nocardioides daejeonensis]|uniref:MFS transporter n=1 Tax=Nocardioides daejeonensis TaxID=1046556 RepID=UPI0013A5ADCE|nr:MFS transporter [Nocardioides daejeonensis]